MSAIVSYRDTKEVVYRHPDTANGKIQHSFHLVAAHRVGEGSAVFVGISVRNSRTYSYKITAGNDIQLLY